jgi:hypothetical protein
MSRSIISFDRDPHGKANDLRLLSQEFLMFGRKACNKNTQTELKVRDALRPKEPDFVLNLRVSASDRRQQPGFWLPVNK